MANVAMAEAMARSGLLTVSVDLRLGGEAPYPASVQDANYGIRWLKMKAPGWNGDPSTLGLLGSSSGGHVAMLLGMRPQDPKSEEHTSELQSLMRTSYADFCLNKKH